MGMVIRYKKVVREMNGKLVSMIGPPFRVVYEVGKWVQAPVGGLLVWGYGHEHVPLDMFEELWKVEVRHRVELPKVRVSCWELFAHDGRLYLVHDLWEGKNLDPTFTGSWPVGTEAWKEVKLLHLMRSAPRCEEKEEEDETSNSN
jgi:hypothetical protein